MNKFSPRVLVVGQNTPEIDGVYVVDLDPDRDALVYRLRLSAWLGLLSGFCFGIPERFLVLASDGVLVASEIGQLLIAIGCFVMVVALRPAR